MYIYYDLEYSGNNDIKHITIIASNGTGKELGNIYLTYNRYERVAIIHELFVNVQYRNNGIGSLLLEAAISYIQNAFTYWPIDIIAKAPRQQSPLDRFLFRYGFNKNNLTHNYELREAREHNLLLRINEMKTNDSSNVLHIIESSNRIYCVINNLVIYTAVAQQYRRFKLKEDLENAKYDIIVDFDCRKPTALINETIMLLGVEKILRHIEARGMASEFNCEKIIVSHGVDKQLSDNILFKDILYPMGYKYNVEEKGFMLKLWK